MKAVSGAACVVVRFEGPERLVPGEDDVEQQGGGDARHRHRREHEDDLLPRRRAIHARRLEDVARDLLEVGVEHPDHDRQVGEAEDRRSGRRGCRAGRGRGRSGRSAPARRPAASSWWRASTAACPRVRLVGAKAIAQAAGTAISRRDQRRADRQMTIEFRQCGNSRSAPGRRRSSPASSGRTGTSAAARTRRARS